MGRREICAVDLETKGLISKGVVPEIICVSVVGNGWKWCKPWNEEVWKNLVNLAETCTFIFHNSSFDRAVLRGHGVNVPSYEDTIIMSYVWEPSADHSLKAWGDRLEFPKLEKPWDGDYPEEFNDTIAEYCLRDSELTYSLYQHLDWLLQTDEGAYNLYKEIELPYSLIIQEMERVGLYLDVNVAQSIGEKLRSAFVQILNELQEQFPKVVQKVMRYKTDKHGHKENLNFIGTEQEGNKTIYLYEVLAPFNPNSAAQIANVLMSVGWKPEKMTDKGKIKTDESVLESITEEPAKSLSEKILQFKKAEKLVSSFVEPLAGKHIGADGFVRGHFNQTITITGRLSSSNPNMQQIPRHGEQAEQIRSMFASPHPDWVMFDGDLSNIEARVVSYYLWLLYDDDSLARIFIEGRDFHTSNSEEWGITRNAAKTVFFARLYGSGVSRISRTLNCSIPEAQAIINTVLKKCPALESFKEDVLVSARAEGGVLHTLYGRRLVYPKLYSDDESDKAEAERKIFNALIQGTSADILKILTIASMPTVRKYEAFVAAAIHDELLGYVPIVNAGYLCKELDASWSASKLLEIPGKGEVPISVEFRFANNWKEAH